MFAGCNSAATGSATVTVIGTPAGLGQAASITLAVSAATGTGGAGTVVDLSSALLTPPRNSEGMLFDFGPANEPDAVSGFGQPITLGMFGNQTGQIVKVTYTDGTTSEVARSSGGRDSRTFCLYGYYFDLNRSKTVESRPLPNNRDVVVLSVTLTEHQLLLCYKSGAGNPARHPPFRRLDPGPQAG